MTARPASPADRPASRYSIAASGRSLVLYGVILVVFAASTVGAAIALTTEWEPWYEQRFGTVGIGFVVISGVIITPWLASGLVRCWPHRTRIMVVTDSTIEVQEFRGRVSIPLERVSDVEARATQAGHRLRIRDVSGRWYIPMLSPEGSSWEAEAERVATFIGDVRRG